jgi:hypothetical protein
MPHSVGDKLVVLSLTLEAAVRDERWQDVSELLNSRAAILEAHTKLPKKVYDEIAVIDERMLNELRKRLASVKTDLRNLSAALRISNPYGRQHAPHSVSIAS